MENNNTRKRPQDKWDEKAGLAAKTYKIDKKTAEECKKACGSRGRFDGRSIDKTNAPIYRGSCKKK